MARAMVVAVAIAVVVAVAGGGSGGHQKYKTRIFMRHQILSCHVLVVGSFFIYLKIISSS
jgi:hypothetical protein